MTNLIRRPAGLLVALLAASLLLAGCGSGPNQTGAAAIVGSTAISLDDVQHELDTVLSTQPQARQYQQEGTFDQVARDIVRTRVIHQLVIAAERREDIAIGDQQVDQLISQSGGVEAVAGQLVYDAAGVRELARDELAELALGRKYADHLAITFDYVTATDRPDAVSKANQLTANPNVMENLVHTANTTGGDGRSGVHLTLAQYLQQPVAGVAPLFGALPGTVLVFQPDPREGSQWLVVLIRARTMDASSSASGSVAASATPDDLVAIGISLLQPIGQDFGVRVNPRYGVWDPVGLRVVPTTDQSLGARLSVTAKGS